MRALLPALLAFISLPPSSFAAAPPARAYAAASGRSTVNGHLVPCAREPVDAKSLARKSSNARSSERRDELFASMLELARSDESAGTVAQDLLQALWQADHVVLSKSGYTRTFQPLVEASAELGELRASLLELVFDAEAYPYPHVPPEATEDQSRRHAAAQAQLDAGVLRMREIYRVTEPVPFSKTVKRHGLRVLWVRAAARRLRSACGVEVLLPEPETPPWMLALPFETGLDEVDLGSFGTDIQDGERLAIDRLVRARNRELMDQQLAAAAEPELRERLRAEHEQVEITNDYRASFGLCALAWDSRLYEASRDHAAYLDRTGTIGHMQPEPGRETFQQRAKLAGYPMVMHENCTVSPKTAAAAHRAWARSSAHHRAILRPEMTEMATARAGDTWVQNYGLDRDFRSRLQCPAWRD